MQATRATKKRFRRSDGRRYCPPSVDKTRSLAATRALSRITTEAPATLPLDIGGRWIQAKRPGRTLGGIALSIGLHVGLATLAFGLALQQVGGISAGTPESTEVEVEIISADAFNSAFAESGAAASSQNKPASSDEVTLAAIPLPEPLPPLADPELMPLPGLTPIPNPVGTLAQAIQEVSVLPESPQVMSPEPTPMRNVPPPEVSKPKAIEKVERVEPVEKAKTPVSTAPRLVKVKKPEKGQGETGSGRDAASTLSVFRGSQGQSGTAGAGTFASFRSHVIAHLARYKRYPDAARIQHMRGRVLVTFSLDAGGRVTGVSLAAPSRHPLLDAEALAMVRRASPFPAIPPETGQSSASFTAPIVYDMN